MAEVASECNHGDCWGDGGAVKLIVSDGYGGMRIAGTHERRFLSVLLVVMKKGE